ncbi:hypothetical protein Vretifemale_10407, partial [Volvox reticuliferus]
MGKGQALTVTEDGQVPRLTTLLRVLVADQAGPAAAPYHRLDVSALTVARGSVLEERHRRVAGGVGAGGKVATTAVSSSARRSGAAAEGSLLAVIFGGSGIWEKAPRAARDEYDKFLTAVSSAVEGEHSSTDLRELAGVVWRAWAGREPPDTSRGRSIQQAMKPHREALVAILGPVVRDAALPALWESVTALQGWKAKLAAQSPTRQEPPQQPGKVAAAAAAGGGRSPLEQRAEFGADLEFHFSDTAMSVDQALDLICGSVAGGRGGGTGYVPYGAYSSEPSPAELRQMMAAVTGVSGDSGGDGATPYTLYDDDDDDGETLDRKKLRDV